MAIAEFFRSATQPPHLPLVAAEETEEDKIMPKLDDIAGRREVLMAAGAADSSAMCSGANFEVTGGDGAQDV